MNRKKVDDRDPTGIEPRLPESLLAKITRFWRASNRFHIALCAYSVGGFHCAVAYPAWYLHPPKNDSSSFVCCRHIDLWEAFSIDYEVYSDSRGASDIMDHNTPKSAELSIARILDNLSFIHRVLFPPNFFSRRNLSGSEILLFQDPHWRHPTAVTIFIQFYSLLFSANFRSSLHFPITYDWK